MNLQIFKASSSIILIIIFFNFAFYLHQYYLHLPHQQSTAWNFEQKKLISYIKQNQKNFQKIIFFPNPGGSLELIHNFFLFYWPYDPIIYLSQGGTKICEYGMTGRYSFEKFEFRSISCFSGQQRINPTENIPPKAMIIVDASTYSNQKNFPLPIKKIYNEETNEPLIFIYDSNDILKYQSIFPHEPLKN
jgi:hypothetical protein